MRADISNLTKTKAKARSTSAKSRSNSLVCADNRQVACADVILLNKADLVNDEEMKEVEDTVKYV